MSVNVVFGHVLFLSFFLMMADGEAGRSESSESFTDHVLFDLTEYHSGKTKFPTAIKLLVENINGILLYWSELRKCLYAATSFHHDDFVANKWDANDDGVDDQRIGRSLRSKLWFQVKFSLVSY